MYLEECNLPESDMYTYIYIHICMCTFIYVYLLDQSRHRITSSDERRTAITTGRPPSFPVPRVKFLLVIPTLNMKKGCAESARQVRTGTTIRASVRRFRVGLADREHAKANWRRLSKSALVHVHPC